MSSIAVSPASLMVMTAHICSASASCAASWCLHCAMDRSSESPAVGAPTAQQTVSSSIEAIRASVWQETHIGSLATADDVKQESLAGAVAVRQDKVLVRCCFALHLKPRRTRFRQYNTE